MSKAHSPELWDGVAARYDGLRPDQGLTDPVIRGAWAALLDHYLPKPQCAVLDVGCGTGSLSLLLAEAGHAVDGIDFAPGMIAVARDKAIATGSTARFAVQDGSAPQFVAQSFDAIICRQVLWALPDRKLALRNWSGLLRPGGRLIAVEGRFASGNGISEAELIADLPPELPMLETLDLSTRSNLWGGPLTDQRVLVVAARA